MAVMMPEQIAARAITKAVNSLDFNVDQFAVFFSRSGSGMQARMFNMFLGMCRYWGSLVDTGAVDERDGSFYSLCVYAKRVLDITPHEV